MARPRKDSGIASAEQRLIDAFWALIETTRISDMTVTALCSQAGCSKSTFYTKFGSIEDLSSTSIENEYMSQGYFPQVMLQLVQGRVDNSTFDRIASGRLIHRLTLMHRHGDGELALRGVKTVSLNTWRAILCPTGGEIKPEARAVIEFVIGGVLSVLMWHVENHPSRYVLNGIYARDFMLEFAPAAFHGICRGQGVDEAETLARIESVASALYAQGQSGAGARG